MGLLVIIPKGGTMTAKWFTEVLKKYFILFYRRVGRKCGSEVVIQEDNTPWHTVKAVRAFSKRWKIKLLSLLPQSTDLTPIENL